MTKVPDEHNDMDKLAESRPRAAATLAANTDPLWAAKRALHSIRALYRATAPSDASDARHSRPESSRTALRNGQRAQCAWSLGADWAYSRVQERAAHRLKGLHGTY